MTATPTDYADVIADLITDDALGDYEALGAIRRLYRQLHPDAQPNMAAGLAAAIERLAGDPGAQADAIHLAYSLDLYDPALADAVEAARQHVDDPRVRREAANYDALRANSVRAAGGSR